MKRSLRDCFADMLVSDLKGKNEAGWEKFVAVKGGPDGLVSGWLEEHQLWRYLRGHVEGGGQDTSFPAPVAPSSVKEEDLKPSFVLSSVVARREFLELLHVLKDDCKEPFLMESATELVDSLNRLRGRDKERIVEASRYELFANGFGCAKIELAYSSMISTYLQQKLGQLWAFHQMPACKGTSDILLCQRGDAVGKFHPVCVIECGMQGKSDADMRKSLRGYAVNFCPIVPVGKYFIGVEWLNVDSAVHARLRVKAFYRVVSDPCVHEVVLWNQDEGTGVEQMLCRVMKVLLLAAEHNLEGVQRKPSQWRVVSRNVALDLASGLVFKSFDYRDRWEEVPPVYRRDSSASCRWMPDCRVDSAQRDFTLLCYPLLKGGVLAKKASEFLSVIKELAELHQQDMVHGDIRAYNMLFVEGLGGKLIDFDYCAKHGQRCYPPGYWSSLPDTERHHRAVAENPMRKEHDCFSLGAVMGMYDCGHAGWKELCQLLQSGKPNLDQCLKQLSALGDAALQWTGPILVDVLSEEVPIRYKTSSPTKKQ